MKEILPFSSLPTRPTFRLGAALVALALAASFACAKKPDASNDTPSQTAATAPVDAGPVVDTEVMAFLSEARSLHHQANIREDEGDLPGAVTVMTRLVTAQRPHEDQKIPEVDEVLADAWARLAELDLKRHDLDEAAKAVKAGLGYTPDATYFRGHLLEVEGVIEEARATDLADAGKKDDAQRARARAIELLQEAVKVQEQVIGRALGDAGKR
jgi:tetratricopeptide (TPR) repeat protein